MIRATLIESLTAGWGMMVIEADPFSGRFLPGERVVWSGRPATGIMLSPRDIFLIPVSVLWCGFAVFWTGAVAVTHAGIGMILYGLMFVTIGLVVMVGRFFLDAWLRAGTRYLLTDRRVLISRPRPFSDFTAVSLDRLPDARLSERKDGRGSVRFGQSSGLFGGRSFSIWVPALDPTPQFVAIADARRVFDLVQRSGGH
jgi:hypothetical protein